MIEIHPYLFTHLFIGTIKEAKKVMSRDWSPFWRIVNVASTFHYELHDWKKVMKDRPCYIVCTEYPAMVSVNWVDGPASLYDYQGQGVTNFKKILAFIDKNIKHYNILVVCNQGQSRSPSIGLLYLAKYAHTISNDSYESAKKDFMELYPNYHPGGIADFLTNHWNEI